MTWRPLPVLLLAVCFVASVPVPPKHAVPDVGTPVEKGTEDMDLQLEYQRYLKEVVDALEKDEIFSKKLSEANATDIKTGDIAKHLDLVGHGIRTKLDEIKRQEMERLRVIAREKNRRKNGIKSMGRKLRGRRKGVGNVRPYDPTHVNHDNPHTFEIEDLQKLIQSATRDLEEADKDRKKDFKKYEMEKEHVRKDQLKGMDESHRKEAEAKYEEMQKKHKDHPKLNHPGSEDQLKEVWEKQDHMDKEDFDPKTFFKMHDVNDDGFLEPDEVEALFQNELDKAYQENATEDDMNERYEEMNKMRQHVMKEVDRDKDGLVSLDEFIQETHDKDFKEDAGWDTIDNEKQYTDDEYKEFEEDWDKEHAQPGEINVPPHPSDFPDHPDAARQEEIHPPVQQAHGLEQENNVHQMNQQQQQHQQQQQQQHAEQQQAHNREQEQKMHQQQQQQHAEQQQAHNREQEQKMHQQQQQQHAEQQQAHNKEQEQKMHQQQQQQQHNQPPPPQHHGQPPQGNQPHN